MLRKNSLIILSAVLAVLIIPATAQSLPTCPGHLKATPICEGEVGVFLDWTGLVSADHYLLCWGPGSPGDVECWDEGSNLMDGGPLEPGVYQWHVIAVDTQNAPMCDSNLVTVTLPDDCEPELVPEFPSMFLPASMITGFLGAVQLLRKTREQ